MRGACRFILSRAPIQQPQPGSYRYGVVNLGWLHMSSGGCAVGYRKKITMLVYRAPEEEAARMHVR
jgi:hypothetical protein